MITTVQAVEGIIPTLVFMVSTLPMLLKALRKRNLRLYIDAVLVLANINNGIYWACILSLPFGAVYFLHLFNTCATALLLAWHLRYPRN